MTSTRITERYPTKPAISTVRLALTVPRPQFGPPKGGGDTHPVRKRGTQRSGDDVSEPEGHDRVQSGEPVHHGGYGNDDPEENPGRQEAEVKRVSGEVAGCDGGSGPGSPRKADAEAIRVLVHRLEQIPELAAAILAALPDSG